MLTLKDFSKYYSRHLILQIPKLQLEPGIHWVKGENGSGKTTFFKALAGIHPCTGEIVFDDGLSLHDNPIEYRRYVNYSEAEPFYPGFLTANDLIHFVGKAKGAKAEQSNLSEEFGINHFKVNPCETYSSGMLKKVSIALAFLGSPRLIILDEPLITLDEEARKVLYKAIDRFISGGKTIVLISSHQDISETALSLKQTLVVRNKTIESI
jgi:ABC-2 type transport system ATP-binding protein